MSLSCNCCFRSAATQHGLARNFKIETDYLLIKNKMKSKFSNYSFRLALIFLAFSIFSCESDDEFLRTNTQQSSLSEIESLIIYSGMNRVRVNAVVDDPDISEVRVYWNSKSDSVVLPVSSTNPADTLTTIIDDLSEDLHIFEARAFDAQGNASKVVSAGAQVFGSGYAGSLINRPVASNRLIDSILDVAYGPADPTSGVIGTEFQYENTAGELEDMFIDVDTDNITIEDYKSGSTYRYRTLFVPSVMAIDTIHTDYASVTPAPFPVLTNASGPYEVAEAEGRWGTLAHWISNEAVKNHNGYGGYDDRNGFNVESGWGAPGITNGKIYQVVTAGAASYTLNVEFTDNNHSEADEGGFYIVVAKGEGLPDVEKIATAPEVLGYERVTNSSMTYNIDFTVDETMEISVGIVTTQDDSGRFGPISSFEILPGSN